MQTHIYENKEIAINLNLMYNVCMSKQEEKFSLDMIEQSYRQYKVGSVVTGVVVGKQGEGLVVNIGGKSDGLIEGEMEKEFLSLAKGTSLDVMILTSKAENGLIKVSAKKAVDTVAMNLQIPEIRKGAKFEAVVESANNAGLTCFFGAYRVFVPAGEVEEYYVRDLGRYKGKTITLVATDFDEERRSIVASRKAHVVAGKTASREMFWHGIFINKLVTGKVVRITPFGAFVEVDGVDCLVHNSEVSYDRNANAGDILEVGKEYQFRVLSVDRDAGKVQLSHKATAPHPFDEKVQQIDLGQIYDAEITKILPYGAIAKLPNGLEGMIHVSELSTEYVQSVHEVCKVGETKQVMVVHIDDERRKVSLSIKATMESGEPDIVSE